MNLQQQGEMDKWREKQDEALLEVENAQRKANFCEQMIDRILTECEIVVETTRPQLYLIKGGL